MRSCSSLPSIDFWAKLGNEEWPEKYHPVICHLIDVGQVALAMWKTVLRQSLRNRITEQLGLDFEGAAGQWVAFWIGAHDIGKLTPGFQFPDNSRGLRTRLLECGFDTGSGNCDNSPGSIRCPVSY